METEYKSVRLLRNSEKAAKTISEIETEIERIEKYIDNSQKVQIKLKEHNKTWEKLGIGSGLVGLKLLSGSVVSLYAQTLIHINNDLIEKFDAAIKDAQKKIEILKQKQDFERNIGGAIKEYHEFWEKLKSGNYRDPVSYPQTQSIV